MRPFLAAALLLAAGSAVSRGAAMGERFPDFAVRLWGLPAEARPDASRVETNAREAVLAWNTRGEHHLVLFFDLYPGAEVTVRLLDRSP